jgi:DNA repair photolyase
MLGDGNKKHGLTVRGDCLYCPLPISIESYWWCEPNCLHCWFRGLNHVWGKDLRPIDVPTLENKLRNGLTNSNPRSALAHALHAKKTIRIGNKADPFQPVEREHLVSTGAMRVLRKLDWTHLVQTRFTDVLNECADREIYRGTKRKLLQLLIIISPGQERDWELFEQEKTPSIENRLTQISDWIKRGVNVGVNGEPFIPGFHTVDDFEDTLKRLKAAGVRSYNTYNFHFTAHVAKRIVNLPGVDIEKIWKMNQDKYWKPIQVELTKLATKHDIILGCPDFVNTGMDWVEKANTCCGIDVPEPSRFNTHHFKRLKQQGVPVSDIAADLWEGIGDFDKGEAIVKSGKNSEFYTLGDIK